MPHLWNKIEASGLWGVQPLAGESCLVVSGENGARFQPAAGAPGLGDVRLLPPDAAGGVSSWALLAGRDAGLRVNGQRLALGLRALRDRDEISAAGQRWFFSTDELACVVPLPELDQPACCPRCKQKLELGSLSVACPHCHAWHHQTEQFPCWTYEPSCALCLMQCTALDAGYSWTPEVL